MKIWKPMLLGASLAIALIAGPQPARTQIQRIVDELSLSDDQKAKAKPVLDDDAAKVRAIRANTSLSDEDKRAKIKTIRTDTHAKIKAILTDQQWKQLEQARAERKKRSKKK